MVIKTVILIRNVVQLFIVVLTVTEKEGGKDKLFCMMVEWKDGD